MTLCINYPREPLADSVNAKRLEISLKIRRSLATTPVGRTNGRAGGLNWGNKCDAGGATTTEAQSLSLGSMSSTLFHLVSVKAFKAIGVGRWFSEARKLFDIEFLVGAFREGTYLMAPVRADSH